jgi:hypothetical protein
MLRWCKIFVANILFYSAVNVLISSALNFQFGMKETVTQFDVVVEHNPSAGLCNSITGIFSTIMRETTNCQAENLSANKVGIIQTFVEECIITAFISSSFSTFQ